MPTALVAARKIPIQVGSGRCPATSASTASTAT